MPITGAIDPRSLQRLRRKLEAIPDFARKAISEGLEENARELVAAQKRVAPRDDGDLIASIKYEWTQPGRQSAETRASVKGSVQLSIDVTAGDDKAYYARWVEFGTRDGRTPKQPFFFPTYRVNIRRFRSRITRKINQAYKRQAVPA